jgi:hypothetical protein
MKRNPFQKVDIGLQATKKKEVCLMKARPSGTLSFPHSLFRLAVEASCIPAGPVGFIAGVAPGHGHSRWKPGKFFKEFLKEPVPSLRAVGDRKIYEAINPFKTIGPNL